MDVEINVYVCALHRIWCRYSVQQLSRVMSFLCMGRCETSRMAEVSCLPALRTTLFLVLPACSCREGPEHFGPTRCVRPRTRVSCLIKRRCTGEWTSERVVLRRALLTPGHPASRPPNGWSREGSDPNWSQNKAKNSRPSSSSLCCGTAPLL